MASFKKTTYLLLFLFFVGFFFSLYAETQRVRGKDREVTEQNFVRIRLLPIL